MTSNNFKATLNRWCRMWWISSGASLGVVLLTANFCLAQNPTIQRAMRDELARNVQRLKLDTLPGPYFIAFRVDDAQSVRAAGAFGALVSSYKGTSRTFRIAMRVGSPSFDNHNFFSFSGGSGLRYAMGTLGTALEDDYDAMRRDLWLSTDAVYKTSLQELSKKQAAFEHKTRSDDTLDFTSAPPFHLSVMPRTMALDSARWNNLVRELSGIFSAYPEIMTCNVSAALSNAEVYYITSEGTDVAEPGSTVQIEVTASTQAADGMPLQDALQWVELSADHLPSMEAMRKEVKAMAERLVASRTAPVLDEYTGPVLVEKQAAAEIFGQVFADAVCAIRRPDVDNPQMKMALSMLAKESPFQTRFGSRVLPVGFTVDDLPGRDTLQGVHCVGVQTDDDEGVPSPNVRLVDHGIMKTLLTCRTPHKKLAVSNGRGASMPARPAITNLVFNNSSGVSDADLKARLIEQCKARELPFGLKITRMTPPSIRSGDQQDMMMLFMSRMGGDGDGEKVSRPTAVYKVYPDGHEELARGVELGGVGLSAFKDILAAGSALFVYNTMIEVKGMESPFQGADTKTATIAVPNVLFDELSAKKIAGPFKTLPVVDAPQ